MRLTRGIGLCLLLLCSFGLRAQPDGMLSGNLSSVGSDTLANLMSLWAQDFSQHYPNINLQMQAAGSSTAPTALAAGAAQLGPMSRPMKAAELAAFEQRYGYAPLAVPVAVDALVVLVHQDNPLPGLNLGQLDQIFSATRRCGAAAALDNWGQLALPGAWAQRSIQRFGRNSASGTYGYFKLRALCGGDFMARVNELPGSASVVQAVSGSLNSIGYASIGFRASGVRLLPLAERGDRYVPPSVANVRNGSYPLARYLYIYINKAPQRPLEPLTAAFLDRVLSAQGQALVNQDGYLPLSPETLRKTRLELGLK
ncbi:Phosphate-binding protein pstS precursor [Serratia rubidaea]|uniref:PstS family phosphate ABC transporter substrate-binding protein n=1 Tax=Serratia rubidaea TaxID=61652 RepID=UPI0006C745F1|nr:phosphate ABC transporter substrate-binding protein PstS family protein [Serratia rubidaea]MBD8450831.1 phosphate ABC transporter substrate-binding protein PstS family protein [Serratia rubidaea]MDC6112103.1 phosphate ABC transporter substrate-binding protein PstS family protein [Serratia rubidaea]QPR61565.1 phosphate ABC transporter substrate-binding protein PstS family protein [Serratia rubidaea]CAI1097372.1 Phosphate-binding protein pstS precursor [Serratia rubidaea]CAI1928750.1 Phosphat